MRALITGATGFVGRELLRRLPLSRILSRSCERARAALGPNVDVVAWDWRAGGPPPGAFEHVDVVVHLAGESVAQRRWSPDVKELIRASRVESTRLLVDALLRQSPPPRTLICSSGVGYYGNRGEELLEEGASAGTSFLAKVCVEWEAAARRACDGGVRVVSLRTGVVLDPSGGALKQMLLPFKLGLGGVLGSGRQWFSWIERGDLARVVQHCIETTAISGPVNAVAPEPVQNRTFVRELGRALHRPTMTWTPAPMLRLVLGEIADELLASQRVAPSLLAAHGFKFRHPALAPTLVELFANR